MRMNILLLFFILIFENFNSRKMKEKNYSNRNEISLISGLRRYFDFLGQLLFQKHFSKIKTLKIFLDKLFLKIFFILILYKK